MPHFRFSSLKNSWIRLWVPGSLLAELSTSFHLASLTRHDVLGDNVHVFIAIRPRVFVPEADHVTQFVHDDAEFVAVFADGDRLGPVTTAPHE